MTLSSALLAAWLMTHAHNNDISRYLRGERGRSTEQIGAMVDQIVEAARAEQVPPALLFTIGVMESGLGSAVPNGGEWGLSRSIVAWACRRHGVACGLPRVPAQIRAGALVLRHGHEQCRTWVGAARYYRRGVCSPRMDTTGYGVRADRMRRALERAVERLGIE